MLTGAGLEFKVTSVLETNALQHSPWARMADNAELSQDVDRRSTMMALFNLGAAVQDSTVIASKESSPRLRSLVARRTLPL
jgi:hypothetical protein